MAICTVFTKSSLNHEHYYEKFIIVVRVTDSKSGYIIVRHCFHFMFQRFQFGGAKFSGKVAVGVYNILYGMERKEKKRKNTIKAKSVRLMNCNNHGCHAFRSSFLITL